ncbi:MAG: cysteine synthase A [Gammaproteobacteria bacterium]|nr:cysteine synthase A [Gammaproteobacteria bacterium]
MKNKFNNILETIGNTPVVKIEKIAPPHVNLYVKLEAFNPGGSVKDRLALGVIQDAEGKGLLQPGQTVVEATSGNTGIGLAVVCAQRGYPLVIVMAENFSVERRKMMRFLGAKVILTPAALKGSGMLAKAKELADKHGWFLTRQFENEANADIHSKTTAVEILRDFEDEALDYWITGFGTGGTLNGVSRILKKQRPETKIIVCEPDNSQLIGSNLPQPETLNENEPSPSHPSFRPHLMQGWTPDFISKLVNDAIQDQRIDQLVPIAGKDALHFARALAKKEGIFTGITGGATFAGAVQVANSAAAGSTLLCMLPDTGERYLSTPLFEDIDSEMDEEEIDIARSTPNYRFDTISTPEPDKRDGQDSAATEVEVPAEAQRLFEEIMQNRKVPVILYALQWCEFCWAVRKLLSAMAIPYRSIDLDSVEYQKNDRGGKIRKALHARTGTPTIPQVFIGDELIGGCTELFDAVEDGHLQQLLKDKKIKFDSKCKIDPAKFLPNWIAG